MNFKFLKTLITEDHEKTMTMDEMTSYLNLLYKKCDKKSKDEFMKYLKDNYSEVKSEKLSDFSKYLCDDAKTCDDVIHKLENISNKVNENSLSALLKQNEKNT